MDWIDIIWAKVRIFLFEWVFLWGKSRGMGMFWWELMGRVGKMEYNKKGGQGRPPLTQEK